ncbi:SDR family oxidoreductase [Rhodocytophaga rosea]|uniref:SDR family oxidoreductase n=1 Tax=Rhodocytophaga rosea TaxID=2704465 RepID=A0A6C0GKY8_9BACT|nr:SDR family oxidoreductase [Rhodocytophaga rosea]QHT68323.1 SDR family oxidoreductase [Rhodocytophaga rosea]
MYETPFHKEDLSKYSFLITGGAGFIGSNLAEYLLKYNAGKVRILDDLSTGFDSNIEIFNNNTAFEYLSGDIRDIQICQEACKGVDIVLHQAALGSVPRSIKDPVPTNAVNIDGFLNMLIAARDNKVKRFVYAASSSVYGDSKELPKVEDRIGKPLSPYAVTKLVNELYADVFARTYQLPVIGLRYFNVFGPRQSPKGAYAAVIPLFIQAISQNTSPVIFGDGEQTRDFTFVENAVQANIRAAFAPDSAINQVYNIAVGESTSLNQLFYSLAAITGSTLKPTYVAERSGDIRNSLADISKANTLLNYQPAVKIKQGLQITWDWFMNHK